MNYKVPELPVYPYFHKTFDDDYEKNKPDIIGYIELDNLHFIRNTMDRDVKFDLDHCFEEAKRKPYHMDVKIDKLLEFLQKHENRLQFNVAYTLEESFIFCNRGALTKIMCTPFEKKEHWKMFVALYKGKIFLCLRDTEEKLHKVITEHDIKSTSWGYKFEQYMTSDAPNSEPNLDVPNDEYKEFNLVFKRKFCSHTLVYRAEMDGARSDKEPIYRQPPDENPNDVIQYLSQLEFVELKTANYIPQMNSPWQIHKARRWWCQSSLVNVDLILCGIKEDKFVKKIQRCYVNKLKENVKSKACLNFLDEFLTYVKRCLRFKIINEYGEIYLRDIQKLNLITLQLEWKPNDRVKISPNYKYEDDPIFPEWYLKMNPVPSTTSPNHHKIQHNAHTSYEYRYGNERYSRLERQRDTAYDRYASGSSMSYKMRRNFRSN